MGPVTIPPVARPRITAFIASNVARAGATAAAICGIQARDAPKVTGAWAQAIATPASCCAITCCSKVVIMFSNISLSASFSVFCPDTTESANDTIALAALFEACSVFVLSSLT